MARRSPLAKPGDQFGPWTVVLDGGTDIHGRRRYAVKCKCGNRRTLGAYYLNQIKREGRARCIKCPKENR